MLDPLPPDEIGPPASGEGIAVVAWLVTFVILLCLPFLGVECLFDWCVVQEDDWPMTAGGLALPVLLLGFVIAAIWRRLTGQ